MKRKRTTNTECNLIPDKLVEKFLKQFPKPKPGLLERKLIKLLDSASDEREVHAFLKRHDFLVGMAFRSDTNPRGVVSEFSLGGKLRCDFLVLSCCSACWSADFVELKPPNSRLYLRDRTHTKALRVATRQIRDRKQWARENEPYLRNSFSDLFARLKLCASGALQVADAATEIRDPYCNLVCNFHIVIGRRQHLSTDEQRARVQDSLENGVRIATYDRFVEAARRYDQTDKSGKESFRHWKG